MSAPDALEPLLSALTGMRQVGASEDLSQVLQRGLALACRITSARAGVLCVLDELHTDRVAHVLAHGEAEDETVRDHLTDPPVGETDLRTITSVVPTGRRAFAVVRLRLEQPARRREQALVDAVMSVVGARIDALQQRSTSQLHEQVVHTVWELDRTLVDAVDLETTLPLLVDRVRSLADAGSVALVGLTGEGSLRVLAADGPEAGRHVAELRPDLLEALRTGREATWSTHGASVPELPPLSTSILPLERGEHEPVVLLVHRWRTPPGLTHRHVSDVLSALAVHASTILDRELGEREHDLLTLLQDRDRIARDLHDLVIQRLFAVGLTLQGASRRAADPELSERLGDAVGELDQTIRDIRATIFQLRHRPGAGSFRADLRTLVESYAPTLGFAPVLRMDGPLDSVADDEVAGQVLLVAREALSNVARHARATSVRVHARADAGGVGLTVTDDGVGLPPGRAESGLANIRERAAERDGRVELGPAEGGGTRLSWYVPT